jgi:hypothetical protein
MCQSNKAEKVELQKKRRRRGENGSPYGGNPIMTTRMESRTIPDSSKFELKDWDEKLATLVIEI